MALKSVVDRRKLTDDERKQARSYHRTEDFKAAALCGTPAPPDHWHDLSADEIDLFDSTRNGCCRRCRIKEQRTDVFDHLPVCAARPSLFYGQWPVEARFSPVRNNHGKHPTIADSKPLGGLWACAGGAQVGTGTGKLRARSAWTDFMERNAPEWFDDRSSLWALYPTRTAKRLMLSLESDIPLMMELFPVRDGDRIVGIDWEQVARHVDEVYITDPVIRKSPYLTQWDVPTVLHLNWRVNRTELVATTAEVRQAYLDVHMGVRPVWR